MELTVNSMDYRLKRDGNLELILTADKVEKQAVEHGINELSNKYPLTVKIGRKVKKRSLDANAYAWVLVSKIAEAVESDKDSVYLACLKRYGQQGIVKIPSRHVENFKRAWKYCEEHEKLFAEEAVYMRFWVGSSNYNTEEMSKLIDGVVSDAQELGIETMTPDEIAKLKDVWGCGVGT